MPGATPLSTDCTRFMVWAPLPATIELHVVAPEERIIPLPRDDHGISVAEVHGISTGARYFFRVNGEDRPDPASRYQPEGVHGPSEVVSVAPEQTAGWTGLPISEYIIYEVHAGTFTPAGTLDAIIQELTRLHTLGITAVELMPVAEFPGSRNWGYDGVFPYAVHHSYGGPEALRRLAHACHEHGMAVVLDVVYNHLGPGGNYLAEFGPYFTAQYRTPWGGALNFDGAGSDHVRRYFIENALYWADCGIDALRLDAVHAIFDRSAYPFLRELADAVRNRGSRLGRSLYLIAESDLNDARLLLPPDHNGFGLDAQWSDDFHHSFHALLTGERAGYYEDFGNLSDLAETLRQGWLYSGQYSKYRQRRHGNSPAEVGAEQLVVCSQNHDQVGNRALGERLIDLAGFDAARLAAAAVLLSPFVPLLFMGEEYGETAPFLYFVSHSDEELVKAVRAGRRHEFPAMHRSGEFPNPDEECTFLRSKLNPSLLEHPKHGALHRFYTELLRLRRTHAALGNPSKTGMAVEVAEAADTIVLRRWHDSQAAAILLHFGRTTARISVYLPRGTWSKAIDSCESSWGGPGTMLASALESAGSEVELSLAPLQAAVFLRA